MTRMVGTDPRKARGPAGSAADAAFAAAHGAFARGDFADAESRLRAIIARAPGHATAHHLLGAACAQQGKLDEAVRHVERAIALAPKDASAYNTLGIALRRLGRMEAAIVAYERALRLDSGLVDALANLGLALRALGRHDEALARFEDVVRRRPGLAEARLNLGNALKDLGRLDDAIAAYREGLRLAPDHAELSSNLGVALHHAGALAHALSAFDHALARRPTLKEARIGRARLLHDQRRHDDAIAEWRRVLEAAPDAVDALIGLGLAEQASGRSEAARTSLERAVGLAPERPDALGNLANLLRDGGKRDEAVSLYQRALALRPEAPDILCNLGIAQYESGRLDEAEATMAKVAALKPDYAVLHTNLGVLRTAQGRPDEAIACYRRAIALDPNDAKAHQNLCAALLQAGDLAGALEIGRRAVALGGDDVSSYQLRSAERFAAGDGQGAAEASKRAVALDPANAMSQQNLCAALVMTGEVEGALDAGRRAVALDPTLEASRFNLACAELLSGDLAAGFAHYESRPHEAALAHWRNAAPLWSPAAPAGARVLVYVEQGMGDAIQFARYLPILVARGDRIVLGLHPPLRRLLGDLPGVGVVTPEEPVPKVDYQIRLLSLPAAFGTTLESIPRAVPYLAPPPDAIARWRGRLGGAAFNVGLVWRGNPKHRNDRNRSLDPATLAPLLSVPGVRWVSLQKGALPGDLEALRKAAPVEDWTEELADFADSAALVAALDLVVTVDTSVAHLAGALGKALWLLLPFAPDWRWLMGRDDSPWYPSARLFRQSKAGDWPGVIAGLVDALKDRARERDPAALPADSVSLKAEADRLARGGRTDEAKALYRKALVVAPDDPDLLGNLAAVLIDDGALDEGIALCRSAIQRAPERPRNHVNLALGLLASGRLGEGFDEYEWRYRAATAQTPSGTAPPWTPETPKGATVIVEAEQGVGDEILYASMLPDLARAGARVITEADARLVPLFRRSFPGVETLPRLPEGKRTVRSTKVVHSIPAASLGRFFRRAEADFPRGPYLKADPAQCARLRAGLDDGRLLCGLSWWSRRAETGPRRSPPLEAWSPLLATPGVRFVSLQYDAASAGLETLRRLSPSGLDEVPSLDVRGDLDGLAALVGALDLVITIGNVTADLAGALGQDAWVLLPANPDWRWQRGREDCPWYPRSRLFRQSEHGRWDDVMTRVAMTLGARLATGRGARQDVRR